MPSTNTCARSAWVARQSADNGCRAFGAVRLGHVLLAVGAYSCFGLRLLAQTPDSRTIEEAYKSWTATTDSKSTNLISTRIIESHSRNGNQTLDKRSVQIPSSDGHFEPYQDIETETLQVDDTTVRTTTRTFGHDVNGRKALVQVTEEERHALTEGGSNVVRTTSNPDVNGTLQPVQRETVETKKIGVDVEETKTTVMLPSVNGGLAPALKTDELRRGGANGTVESQQTTLLADGAGNWQVAEIRQNTVSQAADDCSSEERVFRRDADGKLSEVSHVVSKESESTSGERRAMVETYSIDVPGETPDGSLHLVERTTTAQRTSATGEQVSEQQVEQSDPGDPDSGLRVSILVNDTVRPGPAGAHATRTIRMRDVLVQREMEKQRFPLV